MVETRKMQELVARDIMAAPVVCVGARILLADAEQLLVDAHVTGVPVVENERLLGIITRSDFVRLPMLLKAMDGYVADREYEDGMQQEDRSEDKAFRLRIRNLTVGDVMTRHVVTCAADTPLSDVAAKMIHHHVHRIVVVEDGRPIGIVGSLDVVKLLQR